MLCDAVVVLLKEVTSIELCKNQLEVQCGKINELHKALCLPCVLLASDNDDNHTVVLQTVF